MRNQIRRYCLMLWERNQQINLTRHTDWDTFVCRDLVDTLMLAGLIEPNAETLDLGTGGGVPGLLLAILRRDLSVNLSESVGKRARVLSKFALELDAPVRIYHDRGENLLDQLRFDVVTARAVGPLSRICRWMTGRWKNLGRMLAIKGPQWELERAQAEEEGLLQGISLQVRTEYCTPGSDWKSVILDLSAKRAPR